MLEEVRGADYSYNREVFIRAEETRGAFLRASIATERWGAGAVSLLPSATMPIL